MLCRKMLLKYTEDSKPGNAHFHKFGAANIMRSETRAVKYFRKRGSGRKSLSFLSSLSLYIYIHLGALNGAGSHRISREVWPTDEKIRHGCLDPLGNCVYGTGLRGSVMSHIPHPPIPMIPPRASAGSWSRWPLTADMTEGNPCQTRCFAIDATLLLLLLRLC